jgi:hypothetical protein
MSSILSLVVAHVEGVPHVMFESPRCNAARAKYEKLFLPRVQSAVTYCRISPELALFVVHGGGGGFYF